VLGDGDLQSRERPYSFLSLLEEDGNRNDNDQARFPRFPLQADTVGCHSNKDSEIGRRIGQI